MDCYCEEPRPSARQHSRPLSVPADCIHNANNASRSVLSTPLSGRLRRLAPPPSDRDDDVPKSSSSRPILVKIEIWNEAGAAVEQIVAVTANASIGYAAYYAATREFPDPRITLRQRIAWSPAWSGPKH